MPPKPAPGNEADQHICMSCGFPGKLHKSVRGRKICPVPGSRTMLRKKVIEPVKASSEETLDVCTTCGFPVKQHRVDSNGKKVCPKPKRASEW